MNDPRTALPPDMGDPQIYTVSRLNRECRFTLTETFRTVWIEGEISNLSIPASGHLYFTLKDAGSQVRCAMFKTQARPLRTRPANGDHVLLRAQVSLYEPRGDFQLIVESLQGAGDGQLSLAFERLRQKLAGEGLFDPTHKKPLPRLPECIGVITSPTGAAIQDILTVLGRRFPAIEVILFPVRVQGPEARDDIVQALSLADRFNRCDVLILGRGGGSLEDLQAFNEEHVARAIHACQTPVVSAVGHEIDFTISDFAADMRAPTPSAAAEAVSPDQNEWLGFLQRLGTRLLQHTKQNLRQRAVQASFLDKRLEQAHPRRRLMNQYQQLDETELRISRQMPRLLAQHTRQLQALETRLLAQGRPLHHLPAERCERLSRQLTLQVSHAVQRGNHRLSLSAQELQALSPLATLARGYSITTLAGKENRLASCSKATPGQAIRTRLADGEIISRIEQVEPHPET